jgi:integrase
MNSSRLDTFANDSDPFATKRISKLSVYGDQRWVFDAYNPATTLHLRTINWNRTIDGDTRLSDSAYAHLVRVAKLFAYHLLMGFADDKPLKPQTVRRHASHLIDIVIWMIRQSIFSFEELDQPQVVRLTRYLKVRRGPGRSGDYRNRESSEVNPQSLDMKLQPLILLRRMAAEISDVPSWDPETDPSYEKPGQTLGAGASLPIPMEIAVPLFSEAARWIEEYGQSIIDAQERWNKVHRDRAGQPIVTINVHALRALRSVDASITCAGNVVQLAHITKRKFSTLRILLEAACLIVVAGFTGMRSSELASIPVDCLEQVQTSDGRVLLSIKGHEIKTAVGIVDHERWIAGFDEEANPVRLAVGVMARLGHSDRTVSGLTCLFTAEGRNCGFPAATLNSKVQQVRLNLFLSKTLPGAQWRLTPHQFRKTFARFVARNSATAILALRRHFKHVSILMTEQYTGRFDFELYKDVMLEREADMREALNEILGSRFLAGKLGEIVVERNESFRGAAGAQAREQWIDAWMTNGDVPIMLHPYGICFMFRDRAKCGLDQDLVGLATCLGCSNLIVTRRHAPFWTERLEALDQFEQSLKSSGIWSEARSAVLDGQREVAHRFLSRIAEQESGRQKQFS